MVRRIFQNRCLSLSFPSPGPHSHGCVVSSLLWPSDVTARGNADLPGYDARTVPDTIELAQERFQCPEVLFHPSDVLNRDSLIDGVHAMVAETIHSLPIDLKREMYGNIVLSGGTTLLPGFAQRMQHELARKLPSSANIVVRSLLISVSPFASPPLSPSGPLHRV